MTFLGTFQLKPDHNIQLKLAQTVQLFPILVKSLILGRLFIVIDRINIKPLS